jgi:hypothetical protein
MNYIRLIILSKDLEKVQSYNFNFLQKSKFEASIFSSKGMREPKDIVSTHKKNTNKIMFQSSLNRSMRFLTISLS